MMNFRRSISAAMCTGRHHHHQRSRPPLMSIIACASPSSLVCYHFPANVLAHLNLHRFAGKLLPPSPHDGSAIDESFESPVESDPLLNNPLIRSRNVRLSATMTSDSWQYTVLPNAELPRTHLHTHHSHKSMNTMNMITNVRYRSLTSSDLGTEGKTAEPRQIRRWISSKPWGWVGLYMRWNVHMC